jgi:hypothetical protein
MCTLSLRLSCPDKGAQSECHISSYIFIHSIVENENLCSKVSLSKENIKTRVHQHSLVVDIFRLESYHIEIQDYDWKKQRVNSIKEATMAR